MSRRDRIKPEQLAPGLAEGFTEDVPLDRLDSELPSRPKPVEPDATHLNEAKTVPGTRVPLPHFFAEDDTGSVWTDPTGRLQRNVRITHPPEVIEAMKVGMICLRCLEPQSQAFPIICESPDEMGCMYPIRDRQVMDIGMEFEGEQHLGPSKPITEYMEEQELRHQQRLFDQRVNGGSSRRRRGPTNERRSDA